MRELLVIKLEMFDCNNNWCYIEKCLKAKKSNSVLFHPISSSRLKHNV